MNVIPAIDLKAGSCVRLYQGEFDKQTEYSKDPVAVGRHFESLGFSRLHIVDLDGAQSGRQANEIAAETPSSSLCLQAVQGRRCIAR